MKPDHKKTKSQCVDNIFTCAFDYAAIGMALVAPDGRWIEVNNALCNMVGYTREELLTKTLQDITHPDDLSEDSGYKHRIISGEIETYQTEKRYFHKKGSIVHALLSVSLARSGDKKPRFFILQIQDITKRKELDEELLKLASLDHLTGVNNRRSFFDYSNREFLRCARFGEPISLMMLDIDHFKTVNDTHGHGVGDEVLKCIAAACNEAFRSRGVDVFGRLGGEEFAAFLANADAHAGLMISERIRTMIEKLSFHYNNKQFSCTASIGLVTFSGTSKSLDHRLRQADEALYEAKKAGRNCTKHSIDMAELDDSFLLSQVGFISLPWKRSYECGNETIDQQHRRLFEISNALLNDSITGKSKDECRLRIDELASHVIKHFKDEEELLYKAGYSLYEEHRAIHNELSVKMQDMISKFNKNKLTIGEIFNFLAVDVAAKHMLQEDKKFFPLFSHLNMKVQ